MLIAGTNSFASLEEANAYHKRRPYGDKWEAASDIDRKKALIFATQLMVAYYVWDGSIHDIEQELPFPRSGLYTRDGVSLDCTVIPTGIKNAEAELALWVLASDRFSEPSYGVNKVVVDVIEVNLDNTETAEPISELVQQMLVDFGRYIYSKSGSVRLERT